MEQKHSQNGTKNSPFVPNSGFVFHRFGSVLEAVYKQWQFFGRIGSISSRGNNAEVTPSGIKFPPFSRGHGSQNVKCVLCFLFFSSMVARWSSAVWRVSVLPLSVIVSRKDRFLGMDLIRAKALVVDILVTDGLETRV